MKIWRDNAWKHLEERKAYCQHGGEAVDPHQSLYHLPLSSVSWCSWNQLIYVRKGSHPSPPTCLANFRIWQVFMEGIFVYAFVIGWIIIKPNNNDQYLWVSIMYQAYSKHATEFQGIMKHFRRLRLTEVKWFAEVH